MSGRVSNMIFGASANTIVQLLRNICVETLRYLTNMFILWSLTEYVLGEQRLAFSTFVASLLSGLLNYALCSIWVFHKKEKRPAHHLIIKFAAFTLVGAAGLLLNVGITVLLTRCCSLHYLLSNTIAQLSVFFFNFFVRKKVVFRM